MVLVDAGVGIYARCIGQIWVIQVTLIRIVVREIVE